MNKAVVPIKNKTENFMLYAIRCLYQYFINNFKLFIKMFGEFLLTEILEEYIGLCNCIHSYLSSG